MACEAVFIAPHLSHEIIVEIISRLPVKSLCRFRCVSKSWLSLISSPQFSKTHLDLAFQKDTQKQVLIDWAGGEVCSVDWESINDDDVINKGLVAVMLDNSWKDNPSSLTFCDILCSSNGLVCILYVNNETLLVINPCTGESRRIPVESPNKYDKWFIHLHGFGYASKSDDYKLVKIELGIVRIYSLRSETWRKYTTPVPYDFPKPVSGVLLNGALHWVGSLTLDGDDKDLVVSFDLEEETFREMTLPVPVLDDEDIFNISLGVLNECLYVHYCLQNAEGVWVMCEYNNGESWTKISTSFVHLNTLGLAKNRVAMRKLGRKLVMCNFEDGTHGVPSGGAFEIGTYVESLISPNDYVGR